MRRLSKLRNVATPSGSLAHKQVWPTKIAAIAVTLALGACVILICLVHAASGADAVEQTGDDWPAYGGQEAQDHYSILSQINRENVKQLKIAWTFDTGENGTL